MYRCLWSRWGLGVLNIATSFHDSRLAYLIAQRGSRAQRNFTKSLLLRQSDLSGSGWQLKGELAWRTGMFGEPSEIWQRARVVGTFTAVRHFEQPDVPRWLMIKVAPVASIQDANEVVPIMASLSMTNPKRKVKVRSERPLPDVRVIGLDDPWVYEQLTEGMPGGPSSSRIVSGRVDRIAILIECSGYRDGWPWDEVTSLVAEQAGRISRGEGVQGRILRLFSQVK